MSRILAAAVEHVQKVHNVCIKCAPEQGQKIESKSITSPTKTAEQNFHSIMATLHGIAANPGGLDPKILSQLNESLTEVGSLYNKSLSRPQPLQ